MKTTKLLDFIEFCKNQHDIVCNQKYGKIHPYSFHLDMVYEQAKLFMNLVPSDEPHYSNIIAGIYGHDLIEDARITYNDIKEMYNKEVADIVYCCTEEKGRNRKERHSNKFYEELSANRDAVFVKLCDIIANAKYSLLTNSSMYQKYKQEYHTLESKLGVGDFEPMFDYLWQVLNVEK